MVVAVWDVGALVFGHVAKESRCGVARVGATDAVGRVDCYAQMVVAVWDVGALVFGQVAKESRCGVARVGATDAARRIFHGPVCGVALNGCASRLYGLGYLAMCHTDKEYTYPKHIFKNKCCLNSILLTY